MLIDVYWKTTTRILAPPKEYGTQKASLEFLSTSPTKPAVNSPDRPCARIEKAKKDQEELPLTA
ncbi:Hypothetical protein Cul05146_1123 [Corynebacterium ulcerans]|nr:Hypothetical protein Cul05146_1123 [Corynebacterium ulcerans]AKA96616.1 Hypothetical protein CUL131002_1084c [Corynebacterium ulcerans]